MELKLIIVQIAGASGWIVANSIKLLKDRQHITQAKTITEKIRSVIHNVIRSINNVIRNIKNLITRKRARSWGIFLTFKPNLVRVNNHLIKRIRKQMFRFEYII